MSIVFDEIETQVTDASPRAPADRADPGPEEGRGRESGDGKNTIRILERYKTRQMRLFAD